MLESDMIVVANLLHKCIQLAIRIQAETGKPLKAFCEALENNAELASIKKEVIEFSSGFELYDF